MKKLTGVIIGCFYCFPFAFFSIKADFDNGSMMGHLLMIAATTLLAFLGKLFCNLLPCIVGNIVSSIISLYFNSRMADGWDEGYFKPLTPSQLILVVSLFNLVPQYIAISIAKRLKNYFLKSRHS
ncbi:hypothetical protein QNH20_25305 [Neobacillus sp. WH10]|uniref:hypothetical protein n=1 Tax=Neobacillus sp. WH10 TaxID=3047873 RepID=UPI0024C1D7F5|nr:hypothetical protein [Neobacillus sp. WH10]WHY77345.1 hypothetical protein QNH20_25305 [Neobacillus sp. WH10]